MEPTEKQVAALVRIFERSAERDPDVRALLDELAVRVTDRLLREVLAEE